MESSTVVHRVIKKHQHGVSLSISCASPNKSERKETSTPQQRSTSTIVCISLTFSLGGCQARFGFEKNPKELNEYSIDGPQILLGAAGILLSGWS